MGEQDRQKWDAMYEQGAYEGRTWPSEYLAQQLPLVEQLIDHRDDVSWALDVACGAGRNSIYLAQRKFLVEGVDISAVGLRVAAKYAAEASVDVRWRCADLFSEGLSVNRQFQLIIAMRFVPGQLLQEMVNALSVGGVMILEAHMHLAPNWAKDIATDNKIGEIVGPKSNRFRVAPGELQQSLSSYSNMMCLHAEQGLVAEPEGDGKMASLSRLVMYKFK